MLDVEPVWQWSWKSTRLFPQSNRSHAAAIWIRTNEEDNHDRSKDASAQKRSLVNSSEVPVTDLNRAGNKTNEQVQCIYNITFPRRRSKVSYYHVVGEIWRDR